MEDDENHEMEISEDENIFVKHQETQTRIIKTTEKREQTDITAVHPKFDIVFENQDQFEEVQERE